MARQTGRTPTSSVSVVLKMLTEGMGIRAALAGARQVLRYGCMHLDNGRRSNRQSIVCNPR